MPFYGVFCPTSLGFDGDSMISVEGKSEFPEGSLYIENFFSIMTSTDKGKGKDLHDSSGTLGSSLTSCF